MKQRVNVFWFRRDLRLHDNCALFHALSGDLRVLPIFIFDKNILDDLEDPNDKRVSFIYHQVASLSKAIDNAGGSMQIYYGRPAEVFSELMASYEINTVFVNRDYEGYAVKRDEEIAQLLRQNGIHFIDHKDQVIFDRKEVLKPDGSCYTVFTPYSRRWLSLLSEKDYQHFPSEQLLMRFQDVEKTNLPSIESLGFHYCSADIPTPSIKQELIRRYKEQRDFPGIAGTSRIGVHLRFGTLSIRQAVRESIESPAFLNELIWREFYQMIVANFPQINQGLAFKPAYDRIEWRNNEAEFELWCQGTTGYPIVDAGMRELNATGFMHNRVRMVVASFLTKHLLIDWRWGESYFASKLLDYEFASNNGGWQWASGSGCDATPYFRIFNPYLQAKKFDPQGIYIKRWVPELDTFDYPQPMVDHELARKRCIKVYSEALNDK